jgi:hypothetical protein
VPPAHVEAPLRLAFCEFAAVVALPGMPAVWGKAEAVGAETYIFRSDWR